MLRAVVRDTSCSHHAAMLLLSALSYTVLNKTFSESQNLIRNTQKSCTEGENFIDSCNHTIFIPFLVLPAQMWVWRTGTMEMVHYQLRCFWQTSSFKYLSQTVLWNSLLRFSPYHQLRLQLLNWASMMKKSTAPKKLNHSRFQGLSYAGIPPSNPCNKPNSHQLSEVCALTNLCIYQTSD